MDDGDGVGAAEVHLAGPVHKAARHKGRAVVQVPVLTDRVDTRLEDRQTLL